MINVTSAWHRALASDERAWIEDIRIYNSTNGYLYIGNNDIWMNGLTIDDAVSSDSDFQIGCAIVNRLDLTINNIYGAYSGYDFTDCDVFVKIGLVTENGVEKISKGRYIANGATYNGNLIHLECLDYMSRFDVPFSSAGISFPATLRRILQGICETCLIGLGTDYFPHYNYEITATPSDDKLTCREMISYVAQVAGCFAKVTTNIDGQIRLVLNWYNQAALESALDSLDGGIFDGIAVGSLTDFFNTEIGMTELSSSVTTDTWFNVSNSVEFFFNGEVYDNIYIDSDSCFAFGNEEPSTHGHSALKDINVNTAYGQSVLIKYQEISYGSKSAIKIKYKGYTGRGSSKQTEYYLNEYEIFFIDDGSIVINFIALPDELNIGENRIIENGVECRFSPSTSNALIAYRNSGTWVTDVVSNTYQTGDSADGGSFDPWSTGYEYDGGTFEQNNNVHFIQSLYSKNISVDDVVITGVSVAIKTDNSSNPVETHMTGTSGYVVSLEGNPLITTENYTDILAWLGTQLIGFTFRKADISHASDPSIEAGDVAVVFDGNGNAYPIIVSRTTFSVGSSQKTISSAQTPAQNSSSAVSNEVKNYIAAQKAINAEKTARESADDDIRDQLEAGGGLYLTTETVIDAQQRVKTIYYFHNNPNKSESDRQIRFSDAGIAVTANGTEPDPPEGTGVTWYGLTINGDMLINLLSATGIRFDWARGGTLTLGGLDNDNGTLIVNDASNNEIGRWSNSGIRMIYRPTYPGTGNVSEVLMDYGDFINYHPNYAQSTKLVGLRLRNSGTSDSSWFSICKFADDSNLASRSMTATHLIASHALNIYAGAISQASNGYYGGVLLGAYSARLCVMSGSITASPSIYLERAGSTDQITLSATTVRLLTGGSAYVESGVLEVKVGSTTTRNELKVTQDQVTVTGNLSVSGNLSVTGTKPRLVETEEYGKRYLYCYETPSPMFGDVGEGVIGEDSYCYVTIDPIFAQTVNTNQYQVFLQRYGIGECYVAERKPGYFIVAGTEGLKFGWEIKAKQSDFDQLRLERDEGNIFTGNKIDYMNDALDHINQINHERGLIE